MDTWARAGLKRRTIDRQIAVLSSIFRLAEADGIIIRNPVLKISKPVATAPHRRVLSTTEVQKLLDALPVEYQALVYVAVETGMRWGELQRLDIADFDTFGQRLTVRQSKTAAGKRAIPISTSAINRINELLRASGRTGANSDEPLFITHTTDPVTGLLAGTRLNYSNFRSRIFKPAVGRAGLGELKFHDLRRTSATLLISQGASPKVTQERLGHADIRTTLTMYAQGTVEDHQAALRGLHTALAGDDDRGTTRLEA